jgi:hypothetical protein
MAILCSILGASMGSAQGLYVTANAGYGLTAGTQVIDVNYNNTGSTGTYDVVFGSFGEGFKFGASAGYMFNQNLGLELGLSYWLGKSFDASLHSSLFNTTESRRGLGFVATPSIVVTTAMKLINPYARIGVVLGIMEIRAEYRYEGPGPTYAETFEENGGFAFGYAGALGIAIPTGGAVDFFLEAGFQAFTFSPSQSEITAYTVNGINQLESLPRKVTEFKEKFADGESNAVPAVRRPFSSIGMVVGARINL